MRLVKFEWQKCLVRILCIKNQLAAAPGTRKITKKHTPSINYNDN